MSGRVVANGVAGSETRAEAIGRVLGYSALVRASSLLPDLPVSLVAFLESLWSEGRVRVSRAAAEAPTDRAEDAAALEALTQQERVARAEFRGEAPSPSWPAALWAARQFHAACAFLAHRDFGAEEIARRLSVRCPEPAGPGVCYSVDLTFRYLPDLVRLTRAVSADDPLAVKLLEWCREWPLSSVGVTDVGEVSIEGFIDHPGLRGTYADRILERRDRPRTSDPRVREEIRQTLGAHRELAAEVMSWIETTET